MSLTLAHTLTSVSTHVVSSASGHSAPSATSTAPTDRILRSARMKNYPKQVWYLLACFMFVVGVCHYGAWAHAWFRRRDASRNTSPSAAEGGGTAGNNGRFSLRRLPSAIVNAYRVMAFRWTLEIGSYQLNLAEVFLTCAYILAIFVWEFANTTNLSGGKLDIEYWAGRAGTIASAQLPLVTALGTKNNVVSWITGISYDKLNYMHRMTSRVMFVLLWVHGGGRFAILNTKELDEGWLRAGILAMAAFSLLIIVSLRPIRANAYEFFVFIHFSMVLIFLLGGYFHDAGRGVGSYMWPCFIVWGLDRVIRFLRVVIFNHIYFWLKSTGDYDGSVELLSPHFIRLRVPRPSHFHWTPGQTAYIIMPTVSAWPFEAHPFTIASIDTSDELGGNLEKKQLGDSAPYWKELVFLINVRNGFTKRLTKVAEKGQKVKVALDGPYGFTPDLKSDDTVVFVAGGSGITFTLSSFLGVVNDVCNGKSMCRKVMFIWAIRDISHLDWVSRPLFNAIEVAPSHLNISILVYVTQGEPMPAENPRAWDDDSVHSSDYSPQQSRTPSLIESTAVQVLSGRPDLKRLLGEEVQANTGRMSVTVCGSQSLTSATRAALRFPVSGPASILRGSASVILHVESFSYA